MVDNVTLNSGSGGETIAADDISGVQHQRVKIQYGVDGSATDVSDTNPLPIDDAGGSITVDGTVTLGANSGTDIGDVDVTSVVPGTGATNLGKAEDTAHTSGDVGVMSLFVRQNTQADFGADGDYVPGSVDSSGALRVNATNATGTNTVDTAAGGSDDGAVMLVVRDDALSTLTPADGDYTTARVNAEGATWVQETVGTAGGTTLYKNIDVDETEDQIKATGGQVYWIHAMNLANAVRYLKFYNATAANVTVGTTAPDLTFPLPTQGDTNGAGFVLTISQGIAFGTAITVAATTGVADNDSGAPGANEVIVNLGYA